MNSNDVLPEKDLLETAALKRFEYFPLENELKAETDIAKRQYQKLDNTDEFDETINEKSILNNYSKSDLIYDTKHSFFFNIIVIIKDLITFPLNQSIHF